MLKAWRASTLTVSKAKNKPPKPPKPPTQKTQKGYNMSNQTTEKTAKRGKPKERGNRQGTVYYNKARDNWVWQVPLDYDAHGKLERKSGTEPTKSKAEAAKSKAIAERDSGTIAAPDRVTVKEYCTRWLEEQRSVRPKTLACYEWELGIAIEFLGRYRMQEVQVSHLKAFRQKLENRAMKSGRDGESNPIAATTIRRVEARLKAVFKEAIHERVITFSPLERMKPNKAGVKPRVGVALDIWQVEQLTNLGETLQAAGLARFWGVIYSMLSIGLRSGEALGLRWQDVDFDNNTLQIRHTNSALKGIPIREEVVKTHHSRRDITMTPSLRAKLLQQRDIQNLEKEQAGAAWVDTGAVFTTDKGHWFHSDGLGRAFSSLLEWCNPDGHTRRLRGVPIVHRAALKELLENIKPLPAITPHDLRHTAGSVMLRNGEKVEKVSQVLGHASITITYDRYRHLLESEQRQAPIDHMAFSKPDKKVTNTPLN
jgi:integrase